VTDDGLGHLEHDLGDLGRVLCQDNGPIEPATAAMVELLSRPWKQRDGWIEAALETGSLPLIHRILIALRAVRLRSNAACAAWADATLAERILPRIQGQLHDRHADPATSPDLEPQVLPVPPSPAS
jgi:hypothetical protein